MLKRSLELRGTKYLGMFICNTFHIHLILSSIVQCRCENIDHSSYNKWIAALFQEVKGEMVNWRGLLD